jgi:hypothetical protein
VTDINVRRASPSSPLARPSLTSAPKAEGVIPSLVNGAQDENAFSDATAATHTHSAPAREDAKAVALRAAFRDAEEALGTFPALWGEAELANVEKARELLLKNYPSLRLARLAHDAAAFSAPLVKVMVEKLGFTDEDATTVNWLLGVNDANRSFEVVPPHSDSLKQKRVVSDFQAALLRQFDLTWQAPTLGAAPSAPKLNGFLDISLLKKAGMLELPTQTFFSKLVRSKPFTTKDTLAAVLSFGSSVDGADRFLKEALKAELPAVGKPGTGQSALGVRVDNGDPLLWATLAEEVGWPAERLKLSRAGKTFSFRELPEAPPVSLYQGDREARYLAALDMFDPANKASDQDKYYAVLALTTPSVALVDGQKLIADILKRKEEGRFVPVKWENAPAAYNLQERLQKGWTENALYGGAVGGLLFDSYKSPNTFELRATSFSYELMDNLMHMDLEGQKWTLELVLKANHGKVKEVLARSEVWRDEAVRHGDLEHVTKAATRDLIPSLAKLAVDHPEMVSKDALDNALALVSDKDAVLITEDEVALVKAYIQDKARPQTQGDVPPDESQLAQMFNAFAAAEPSKEEYSTTVQRTWKVLSAMESIRGTYGTQKMLSTLLVRSLQ